MRFVALYAILDSTRQAQLQSTMSTDDGIKTFLSFF